MKRKQYRHPCEEYLPLCTLTARRVGYGLLYQDREELIAELHLQLAICWDHYDPNRGTTRRTFVINCLRREALDWMRKRGPGRVGRQANDVLSRPELYSPQQRANARADLGVSFALPLHLPLPGTEGLKVEDILTDPSPSPEELCIEAEEVARVWSLVEELPIPRDRAILALYYGEDATGEEIGHRVGCTRKAAWQGAVVARRRLAARVTREEMAL